MDYRLDLPPGPFGTVYADPPWMLMSGGVRRQLHYDRMTHEEIRQIPVASVVLPDAHLWLWTTNPHLPEALDIVGAWGFTYRSLVTWAKPRMGTGWWVRSKTEHLIFASRTKKGRENPGNVTTLLEAPMRGPHVKPVEAYTMIERLSPGPYLEMFGRQARSNWTTLISHQALAGKDEQQVAG